MVFFINAASRCKSNLINALKKLFAALPAKSSQDPDKDHSLF
jgi:hypothetical protein